jgi:hypothetical protein
MITGLGEFSGGRSIEQQSLRSITISSSGYYRIGDGVRTLKCLNRQVVIVSAGAMFSLHMGGTYASSGGKSEEAQWIWVGQEMLTDGPLQFEVSCTGDVQDDQLLPSRGEVEGGVVSDRLARMAQGVAAQAAKVMDHWQAGFENLGGFRGSNPDEQND